MTRGRACLLAALALAAPALGASELNYDAGAELAMPVLAVPVGVRSTGMGGADAVTGRDVDSLAGNPSGLAGLQGYQLGMAHNEWASVLGLRQELLSYGQPLGKGSALGLGFDYFSLGQLDKRDASGALLGRSNASLARLALGYAWPLPGGLDAGLSAEGASQTLYEQSSYGFGFGAGLQARLGSLGRAGLAVAHLGSGPGGALLPGQLDAGLSLALLNGGLLLALEGSLPFQGAGLVMAGAEGAYGPLRLRAGYRVPLGGEASQNQGGISAGAGFKVSILRLDYSFNPYGELSASHRLQATLELPRDFFQARAAAPEGTSTSAKAFFVRAEDLEHQGESLKALIQYQRGVESYPQELKSNPQDFYLAALKRIDALQATLNKGDSAEIQRLTKESLAAAQWEMKAGRFKEAVARLEQAQSIDTKSEAIAFQLGEARKGLAAKLDAFRGAAQAAAKAGKLAKAVENWKRLLAIEPNDPEGLEFMNRRRGDLRALLQETERKGIYAYVGGRLQEAVKAWREGEALDYFGDLDFRRNIEKALKQMEMGGK